ncbi:MAG: hypothetical protein ABI647_09760 [Gemmatimonadota bacterium]
MLWIKVVFWAVGTCLTLGILVAFYLSEARGLGGWGLLGVGILSVLIGIALAIATMGVSHLAGRGFSHTVLGGGNLAPRASFSQQEALIIRGRHAEAAAMFQAHLEQHPRDFEAQLALGALYAGPFKDPPAAERAYLAIRSAKPEEAVSYRVGQALIDPYQATGERGKHLAELSRFAERYRDTTAGRLAKRALLELKRDEQ